MRYVATVAYLAVALVLIVEGERRESMACAAASFVWSLAMAFPLAWLWM